MLNGLSTLTPTRDEVVCGEVFVYLDQRIERIRTTRPDLQESDLQTLKREVFEKAVSFARNKAQEGSSSYPVTIDTINCAFADAGFGARIVMSPAAFTEMVSIKNGLMSALNSSAANIAADRQTPDAVTGSILIERKDVLAAAEQIAHEIAEGIKALRKIGLLEGNS